MQNIGEGTIQIPSDWQNTSINIFAPARTELQGVSLTVTREKMPFGMDIAVYAKAQLDLMQQQLPHFVLLNQDIRQVDGLPVCLMELQWESPQAGQTHQMLMLLHLDALVLHCCASHIGVMSQAMRQEMVDLLSSFRLNSLA